MTKQEQIKEMARDICKGCQTRLTPTMKCNRNCCAMSEVVAENLYSARYSKLNDGDIIIHKDEKERTDEEVKWLMEHNAEVRRRHEKFLEDSGNIILPKEEYEKLKGIKTEFYKEI